MTRRQHARYGFVAEPIPQPASLWVPRSAVLLAGGNSIVYVETRTGRFEIRPVKVGPILRDRIVILEGLQEGESVATAGNFLIDSQMQLAGKPSLIDVHRAVARSQPTKGPLQFDRIVVSTVAGEPGQKLEALYAAYLQVQASLAADQQPAERTSLSLHQLARELAAAADGLPKSAVDLVQEVAVKSEHLHHLDIAAARRDFQAISRAVVTLASQVRGAGAERPFTQFHCPMVPSGSGDWLQAGGELRNPYFGSQMLRCGERVREFPAQQPVSTPGTAPGSAPPASPAPNHPHGA